MNLESSKNKNNNTTGKSLSEKTRDRTCCLGIIYFFIFLILCVVLGGLTKLHWIVTIIVSLIITGIVAGIIQKTRTW